MPEQIALRENQKQAVEANGKNVIVVAGAGTGKTRVLVERYLWLLQPNGHSTPPDLASLVAITFTEKAAREMRDRVRTSIKERADAGDPSASWEEHLHKID